MTRSSGVTVPPSPHQAVAWKTIGVLAATCGPLLCVTWLLSMFVGTDGPLDLRVYQEAAAAWMRGSDLYTVHVTDMDLPFTYPPFAAVLFMPLSMVPVPVAAVGWWLACAVCVYAVVRWSFRESPVSWLAVFAVGGMMMAAAPVWDTLAFGQVNVFILALACADFLRVPDRARGLLVGLAASVKVTPAFLLLLPVVRRDWTMVARAVLVMVGVAGAVALLFPHETFTYFGSALWDTSRPGDVAFCANQSLAGVLARTGTYRVGVWVACCVAAVGCAVVTVMGPTGRSKVVSLLVVAVTGLLVSPISWAHHWVWVCLGPAAAVLLWRARFRPEAVVTAVFTFTVAAWKPFTLQYADWSAAEYPVRWFVQSNVYVWVAIAWLLTLTVFSVVRRRRTIGGAARKPIRAGSVSP